MTRKAELQQPAINLVELVQDIVHVVGALGLAGGRSRRVGGNERLVNDGIVEAAVVHHGQGRLDAAPAGCRLALEQDFGQVQELSGAAEVEFTAVQAPPQDD